MKKRDNLKFHHVPILRGEYRVALTFCVALLVLGISKFANAAHDASDLGHRTLAAPLVHLTNRLGLRSL